MFLFKDGWSLIINRLSFSSSKNILFSIVIGCEWLQNTKWLVTELFVGLTCFFGKWWDTNMFANSYIQMSNNKNTIKQHQK